MLGTWKLLEDTLVITLIRLVASRTRDPYANARASSLWSWIGSASGVGLSIPMPEWLKLASAKTTAERRRLRRFDAGLDRFETSAEMTVSPPVPDEPVFV